MVRIRKRKQTHPQSSAKSPNPTVNSGCDAVQIPFPDQCLPTPEECCSVRDDLLRKKPQLKHSVEFETLINDGDEKESALDGLVRAILSQNSTEVNSERAFASLKTAFPSWDDVLAAESKCIEDAIRCEGLAPAKSSCIKNLLSNLLEKRGKLSMEYLRELSIEEVKVEQPKVTLKKSKKDNGKSLLAKADSEKMVEYLEEEIATLKAEKKTFVAERKSFEKQKRKWIEAHERNELEIGNLRAQVDELTKVNSYLSQSVEQSKQKEEGAQQIGYVAGYTAGHTGVSLKGPKEIPPMKNMPSSSFGTGINVSAVMMDVPDPDFHDFDVDRSASSFGENEVWATYDDKDGMPRFYALVNEVISRDPLQLRISWLNSTTTTEFSNIDWLGSGFEKTCGEFSLGRPKDFNFINSFSQRLHWSKGPHGGVRILPQKNDVWALYRDWSPDWDKNTPREAMFKYDMVMVLDDYTEEHGLHVAPLVKVVGFRTVFRPNLDPQARKRILREEMFRFSHRVPIHLLTGQEGKNAPKGCLELDPAATPLELLRSN